jgi:hypothetical protein
VADRGVAHFVPVTTGTIGGLDMAIEGIAERTSVVVGPFQALRTLEHGARIKAREVQTRRP